MGNKLKCLSGDQSVCTHTTSIMGCSCSVVKVFFWSVSLLFYATDFGVVQGTGYVFGFF